MSDKRLAYAAWVAVCLVWGATYLAIRIALETIPPFLMASFRWMAAGLLLVTGLTIRGARFPEPETWPALALSGVLLLGVGNGGVVWAEQSVPSGLVAVLVAAIPFWMVGVERLLPGGERLTARRALGLLVGFGGILLLAAPGLGPEVGRSFLLGVLTTQLACLGWALGSSYSRRRPRDENVLAAAALEMMFAGAALLIVGLALGEWQATSFNPRTLGALVYLILGGSIIGFTAYTYALKHLPVATVSLYAYVNPVMAVALGTLALGEPFTLRMALACAIVLLGMLLVRET
jgi:drug/metabolite transporter (DMT)-like permease